MGQTRVSRHQPIRKLRTISKTPVEKTLSTLLNQTNHFQRKARRISAIAIIFPHKLQWGWSVKPTVTLLIVCRRPLPPRNCRYWAATVATSPTILIFCPWCASYFLRLHMKPSSFTDSAAARGSLRNALTTVLTIDRNSKVITADVLTAVKKPYHHRTVKPGSQRKPHDLHILR